MRGPDGKVANLSLRNVREGVEPKALALPSPATTLGVAIARPEIVQLTSGDHEFDRDEVEVCEGGPDFLALTLHNRREQEFGDGRTPPRWVLGVIGAARAAGVVEAFARMIRGRVVRIALDKDTAGEDAARDAIEVAYLCGARRVIRARPPEDAKDWAELWAQTAEDE